MAASLKTGRGESCAEIAQTLEMFLHGPAARHVRFFSPNVSF